LYTKVESTYITVVEKRLGIEPKDLEDLDGSEPILDLPGRKYKIYALFHRLAIVIMIDNSIHEKEKRYRFNLGIKMGLHPNAVGEIIEQVIRHGTAHTLPKDVMDIFRKYLN
jgi:hypothetical protein